MDIFSRLFKRKPSVADWKAAHDYWKDKFEVANKEGQLCAQSGDMELATKWIESSQKHYAQFALAKLMMEDAICNLTNPKK